MTDKQELIRQRDKAHADLEIALREQNAMQTIIIDMDRKLNVLADWICGEQKRINLPTACVTCIGAMNSSQVEPCSSCGIVTKNKIGNPTMYNQHNAIKTAMEILGK